MSIIHRNGKKYRLWSNDTRRYITKPLSHTDMTALLVAEAVERAKVEAAERLRRADAWGTSEVGRGLERDATAWDVEACAICEMHHHAFKARHGAPKHCFTCDGSPDEPQHGPACKAPEVAT